MDIRGKHEEAKRGVLDELLGYQIRRAQTRLFAHFQSQLVQLRMTPGQFGLLILIAENPGITQVALARAGIITSGDVRPPLSEMTAANLEMLTKTLAGIGR